MRQRRTHEPVNGERKRTLRDAPGSYDGLFWRTTPRFDIHWPPSRSLKGNGLRSRERGGRTLTADGLAAELASLDAIPVDPRSAEKEVVATGC
jgi:hypothetical protein